MGQFYNCNTYMHIETFSGRVEVTYDIGKVKKVEVQTQNYNLNISNVKVFFGDEVYSWETDKIYLVGYMMYGISVSKDGRFIFAQQDMNGLYCLDVKTGNLVWKTKNKSEISQILVGENTLCCSKSRDEIQLIDIETGKIINSHKTPFDNRFEVLSDKVILNHTRSKSWEVIHSQTLEVIETISNDNIYKEKMRISHIYRN